MKYIPNNSTNPYYNLAFEEYIFKNCQDDDYLLLWQNDNAIIVGKHQNAIEEINPQGVEEYNVKVVRRITGGGAVYHDMGNLNYSYITGWSNDSEINYDRFLDPVISGLQTLGIQAYKKGRNDIVVDDKKISGNAQSIDKNRILHHGTLLFDSNLQMIQRLLNVDKAKYESKGLKSVRSRVTNMKEYANKEITVEVLKQALIQAFTRESHMETIALSPDQEKAIHRLVEKKYATWDWNYGKSPKFSFKNVNRFQNGKVQVEMNAVQGHIEECKITGDFLALKGVEDIEKALINAKHDQGAIRKILAGFDLRLYFGGITMDELLTCFF